MTDLTIEPKWNTAINRLERNEFATGGADGNMNIAPRQLAENIFWLKDDVDGKLTTLNQAVIAQDAIISSKANTVNVDAKNDLQDTAINSKANSIDVDAKNDLQDISINQNSTDIGGLLVTASEHTTAIIDLDSRVGASEASIIALTNNGKDQNTNAALKFWTGTQLEYDAVVIKDPSTIYLVTE